MATKTQELEQKVNELTQLLAAHGIVADPGPRSRRPEDRADYIPFGGDKHLTFLGLLKVDDTVAAEANKYTVYSSPSTGQAYRLVDEMQAALLMRPMDPDKGILMVLRQKVSSFESGMPKPHAGAPARFNPAGRSEYTRL